MKQNLKITFVFEGSKSIWNVNIEFNSFRKYLLLPRTKRWCVWQSYSPTETKFGVDKILLHRKGLQKSDAVAVLGCGVTAARSCCESLSQNFFAIVVKKCILKFGKRKDRERAEISCCHCRRGTRSRSANENFLVCIASHSEATLFVCW